MKTPEHCSPALPKNMNDCLGSRNEINHKILFEEKKKLNSFHFLRSSSESHLNTLVCDYHNDELNSVCLLVLGGFGGIPHSSSESNLNTLVCDYCYHEVNCVCRLVLGGFGGIPMCTKTMLLVVLS
ncbi:unnamed protein product [Spodoptera exigua]|nr:unnamed protein product [Spodoptera exigua]